MEVQTIKKGSGKELMKLPYGTKVRMPAREAGEILSKVFDLEVEVKERRAKRI